MKVAEKAVSNTIYLLTNWFVLTLLSFLYWVIAGKMLLPDEYGKVTTAYQIMFLIGSLANLGLGVAVSKLVPEFIAKKQEKKIPTLIKFSLKISLTSALLLSLFILLISNLIIEHLELDVYSIILIIIGIVSAQLSSFFSNVWYGYQIMRKILANNVINQAVKLSTAALLLYLGFKHLGPISALTLSYLTSFILYFNRKFIRDGIKFNTKKVFFNYAIPAFLANLAWCIFNNTQYILLNLFKTAFVTGIFAVAFLISSQVAIIPQILSRALFPLISGLSVNKEKEKQSKLISLALRYSLLIGIPLVLFFISFNKPLILIFARSEYLGASRLFLLLAPGALFFGLGRLFLVNIYAIGKSRIYRNISILVSLSYLFLSFFLIRQLADYGLAIAYLVTSLIFFSFSIFSFKKEVKIEFEWRDLGKIFISLLIPFLILYLLDILNIHTILKFVLAAIAGLLYLLGLKITKFYSSEDKRVVFLLVEKLRLKGLEKIIKIFM